VALIAGADSTSPAPFIAVIHAPSMHVTSVHTREQHFGLCASGVANLKDVTLTKQLNRLCTDASSEADGSTSHPAAATAASATAASATAAALAAAAAAAVAVKHKRA